MRKRLYLVIALLVALAVTVGTFAYTQTSASISATVTTSAATFVDVNTVLGLPPFDLYDGTNPDGWPASGKHAAAPSWTPVENSAGSITHGDLYYIDPGDYTGEILINLYITNVGELSGCYSYLIMGVNAYGVDALSWDTMGHSITQTGVSLNYYLTLSNGYVSFILPAGQYVITIDEGAWYCIDGSPGAGESLTPSFYIDVRQA